MRHLMVTGGDKGESGFRVGVRPDGTKMQVVVEPKDLSALFRRDWHLCGAKIIQIEETQQALTDLF